MKFRCLLVICFFIGMFYFGVNVKAQSLEKNLLFYAPFDDTTRAKVAKGNSNPLEEKKINYAEGIKGDAIYITPESLLYYSSVNNLDKERGSVVMWIKPMWERGDRTWQSFFVENGGSPYIRMWKIHSTFRFEQKGLTGDYFTAPPIGWWQKGEWHQVVCTWDNKVGTRLYLDGRLQRHRGPVPVEVEKIKFLSYFGNFTWQIKGKTEKMAIGCPICGIEKRYFMNANAAIDELKIYDRMLTSKEIYREYTKLFPLEYYIKKSVFTEKTPSEINVEISNNTTKTVEGEYEFSVVDSKGNTIKSETKKIKVPDRGKVSCFLTFTPEKWGEFFMMVNNKGNNRYLRKFPLFVIKGSKKRQKYTGKLKLKLIADIDCTEPLGKNEYCEYNKSIIVNSPLGKYREAGKEEGKGEGASRMVFRFKVKNPGKPHLVEITFPDDKDRTMNINYNTPHFNFRYDIDNTVFTGGEYPNTNRMHKLKYLLYPLEEEGAIAFLTWEKGHPAAVARIKICEIEEPLPELIVNIPKDGGRMLGLEYEDPGILQNMGASGLTPTDFYITVENIIDYMKFTGQNILKYPIVFYTGPDYPTRVEDHCGMRVGTHPDNWVEMILKMFEQNDINFMATLTLQSLSTLEKQSFTDDDAIQAGKETINQMGVDNRAARHSTKTASLANGKFNPLDPKVQRRIFILVDEILDKYGDYKSFRGISFNMWRKSFLWWGTKKSGLGDYNINLFEKETGIKIPVDRNDPERFRERYRWLKKNKAEEWQKWRCEKIYELFAEINKRAQKKRKDLRVEICFWDHFRIASQTLMKKDWFLKKDKEGGLDVNLFKDKPGIYIEKLFRPSATRRKQVTEGARAYLERDMVFCAEENVKPFYNGEKTTVWLYGNYFETAVGKKKPIPGHWWKDTCWRAASGGGSEFYFMENYAHGLAALDATTLLNGGIAVDSNGRIDYLQDFARAYRALPAKAFRVWKKITDPVMMRTYKGDVKYYFYLQNRAYYPVKIKITFAQLNKKLIDLGESKEVVISNVSSGDKVLEIVLNPYQLKAFGTEDLGTKVDKVDIITPRAKIKELSQRVAKLEALDTKGDYKDYFKVVKQKMKENKYVEVNYLTSGYIKKVLGKK